MKAILVVVAMSTLTAACSMPQGPQSVDDGATSQKQKVTGPPSWIGDQSQCGTVTHNKIYWPSGTTNGEYGVEVTGSYGQPGCEHSYVMDLALPNNRSWPWAWAHVALRTTVSQENCGLLWTSMRVTTGDYHGVGLPELLAEETQNGRWDSAQQTCVTNLTWLQGMGKMVRIVSQSGILWVPELPQYVYFIPMFNPMVAGDDSLAVRDEAQAMPPNSPRTTGAGLAPRVGY